jgi:hypothetical protein
MAEEEGFGLLHRIWNQQLACFQCRSWAISPLIPDFTAIVTMIVTVSGNGRDSWGQRLTADPVEICSTPHHPFRFDNCTALRSEGTSKQNSAPTLHESAYNVNCHEEGDHSHFDVHLRCSCAW